MSQQSAPTTAQAISDADAAGLRYMSDLTTPGMRRKRRGRGFVYADADGKPVAPAHRERIIQLRIPPAWTDVWIAPWGNAHIQATGRDARGRKQYIYHARWREVRDSNKFSRLADFALALPRIRRAVSRDLRQPASPRERVLAAVVRLLDNTAVRIGNDQYAAENNSFGLTTLRNRHVKVKGARLTFEFQGKSGKRHRVEFQDPRIARVIRECQEIPGQELFQYLDESGARHSVTSNDVNDYLRAISGEDFTAKDFRTWAGTLKAFEFLADAEPAKSHREAVRIVNAAVDATAAVLGNTRAVCRNSYIHPSVLEAFENGGLADGRQPSMRNRKGLNATEIRLLSLIKQDSKRKAA